MSGENVLLMDDGLEQLEQLEYDYVSGKIAFEDYQTGRDAIDREVAEHLDRF